MFFGTPDFAVPSFERLVAGPHPVLAAVTQPDRPRGRGRRVLPCPVAESAERAHVPALRTERAGDPDFVERLRSLEPDLGVVVAFGQFLPRGVRELPRLGYLINAHASLLPRHRGAAPVAHAILAGDTETGISVMRIEREMDAGPVAVVRRTPIGASETTGELSERLAVLAADAIQEAVELAAGDRIAWRAQDESLATLAPKLRPEDARLDFSEPATALLRRVRALAPRPGAFTTLDGARLRILAADAREGACNDAPGTVCLGNGDGPRIATGEGWLVPTVLQRAGGRALEVRAFQRGRPLREGERLGS